MKKQKGKVNVLGIFLACSILTVTATSFRGASKVNSSALPLMQVDTPKKNSLHFDIDMKGINNALEQVDKEFKSIDWNKISKNVTQSIKSIDWDKIESDINNAAKNINVDEIKVDIQKAMDEVKLNINSEEFKKNMNHMKKADMDKLKKEIKRAQKEIEKNKEQLRKDMDKIKYEINNETTRIINGKKINENTLGAEKSRLFFLI